QTFGSPTQLQHLRELLNTTLNNSTDNNKPIENKLTYLSLVLADTIKKMNQSDTLSAKNILDYLILIDKNILTPLEAELTRNIQPITIEAVNSLINTLSYFTSVSIKKLLLENQAANLGQAPITYHLINHIGQKRFLHDITADQLADNRATQDL